ncbi:hypothetical protein LY78DRAFT_705692 [Colletotrichum sublineola]|nr:hypothetical protein LY78DRAFT_705692 [Colletotrichum sublineola]
MSNPTNYTVGWICAITTEFVAAQAFLDERHDKPARVAPQDSNNYALGSISGHNVVIAVLPQGEYGTNSAAVVARDMLHSFPNVRVGLMVGIRGGAPTRKRDIRLGDIVVSCPRDGKGGVLQYDFGKTIQSQAFQQTGFLNQPPQVLQTAVARLKAIYEIDGHQLDEHIESVLRNKPRLQKKYSQPQPSSDRLYKSDIVHPQDTDNSCIQVCGNNTSALILRRERDRDKEDNPAIHYRLIASANQLIKDALMRDKLALKNDMLCFEMEAAGLINHFPCLQGFTAMAATAYAKDLLGQISVSRIEDKTRIEEVLKSYYMPGGGKTVLYAKILHHLKDTDNYVKSIVFTPDFNHIQLLATSRPEEEFQRSIPVWIGKESCRQLDKESITADIHAYINNRLEHSPEFKKWSTYPSVLRKIRDEVGSKADRMFQWAACQLDSLEACLDREGIEGTLQALPQDLNETYSRIFQNIPQQRKMKAIRLLQFLVHSERPLLLEEAVDVVAVRLGSGQRCFDVEDRLPCPADIMRFCPSLVSLTQHTTIIRFEPVVVEALQLAHFSVKEYFLQSDVEGFRHMEASIGITHTCLTYLANIEDKDEGILTITREFPLAEYAAEVWTDHAKLVEYADGVVAATMSFLSGAKTFNLWTRLLSQDYINAQGGAFGNALMAACSKGHIEVFQVLLNNRADINVQGGAYGNALMAASYGGHAEVGADINAQGGAYDNALMAPCYEDHTGFPDAFSTRLADLNLRDNSSQSALSDEHSEEIVSLLIATKKVDVNSRDRQGYTPLMWALWNSKSRVAELLIQAGGRLPDTYEANLVLEDFWREDEKKCDQFIADMGWNDYDFFGLQGLFCDSCDG